MSRWFRSYADKHRNPKVAQLSDADFRLWDQLMCIAAENEGLIPPLEGLKSLLKRRLDHLSCAVERLVKDGLIDASGDGYSPHNWLKRQYKSDCSTDRVKRFRNGGGNVSETPPDTETETDSSEANASADVQVIDPEAVMWRHGRLYLQSQGVPAERIGSLLGKWKKAHGSEAVIVALGKAQREGAIDPVSFITRCLGTNKGRDYDPERITV
jgi:hypothetical protein